MYNIEIFLKAKNVYITKECLYNYRFNDNSAMNNVKNIVRNCKEFIINFADTKVIIDRYCSLSKDEISRLAVSRYNHLIHYHFNKMMRNNLTKDVIDICKNNEQLKEIACFAYCNLHNRFDKYLCSAIIKNQILLIKFLISFKRSIMRINN